MSSQSGIEVPQTAAATDTCQIVGGVAVRRVYGGVIVTETAGRSGTGGLLCRFQLSHPTAVHDLTLQLSQTKHASRSTFRQVAQELHGQTVSVLDADAFYVPASRALYLMAHGSQVVMAPSTVPARPSAAVDRRLRTDALELGRVVAAQI
jgi:hypothetical protein